MTILITRPQPEATAFAEMCMVRGYETLVSPLMEIRIMASKVDLSDVGALAFTSVNGVRAFAQNSAERRLPVFAVGETSADAARAAGFKEIHVAGGDVDALAALIAAQHDSAKGAALHCAGATRAGDLVKALEAENLPARRAVLYEARPIAALSSAAITALKAEKSIDWVALFSPRSARLFVDRAREAGLESSLASVNVACLSDAVAKELTTAQWKSVRIAPRRDSAAMLELLAGA
ncbi:MAG: uroporphyrinogen-III synthase [Pseudomonadota bacterium]